MYTTELLTTELIIMPNEVAMPKIEGTITEGNVITKLDILNTRILALVLIQPLIV